MIEKYLGKELTDSVTQFKGICTQLHIMYKGSSRCLLENSTDSNWYEIGRVTDDDYINVDDKIDLIHSISKFETELKSIKEKIIK